jgi:hypothetical protein
VDTQSAFAVVGFAVPTVIPETHSFGINGAEVARGCIITHAATLALVATQGSCFKGRLTFIGFLKRTLTFSPGHWNTGHVQLACGTFLLTMLYFKIWLKQRVGRTLACVLAHTLPM